MKLGLNECQRFGRVMRQEVAKNGDNLVVLSDEVLCGIFISTETQCQEMQNLGDCFVIDGADQRPKVFEKDRNDLRICHYFCNVVEGTKFHDVL